MEQAIEYGYNYLESNHPVTGPYLKEFVLGLKSLLLRNDFLYSERKTKPPETEDQIVADVVAEAKGYFSETNPYSDLAVEAGLREMTTFRHWLNTDFYLHVVSKIAKMRTEKLSPRRINEIIGSYPGIPKVEPTGPFTALNELAKRNGIAAPPEAADYIEGFRANSLGDVVLLAAFFDNAGSIMKVYQECQVIQGLNVKDSNMITWNIRYENITCHEGSRTELEFAGLRLLRYPLVHRSEQRTPDSFRKPFDDYRKFSVEDEFRKACAMASGTYNAAAALVDIDDETDIEIFDNQYRKFSMAEMRSFDRYSKQVLDNVKRKYEREGPAGFDLNFQSNNVVIKKDEIIK
jgi:hypothetical protein